MCPCASAWRGFDLLQPQHMWLVWFEQSIKRRVLKTYQELTHLIRIPLNGTARGVLIKSRAVAVMSVCFYCLLFQSLQAQ